MRTGMVLSEVGSYQEYEAWWDRNARPVYDEWLELPFFSDLRAGRFTQERLRRWLENWYAYTQEVDLTCPVLWHRHHYILGRFPDLEEIVTERSGKPLNYPYPGGLARGLRNLAAALGVSHDQLLGARLLPQTAHLTSYVKSLHLEGTLAEFASHLIGEEALLRFCEAFREALANPPFSFGGEVLDYFVHWKECLLFRYGSPGGYLLRSLFEKGLVEERPNFGIKHTGVRHAEYLVRLYREL